MTLVVSLNPRKMWRAFRTAVGDDVISQAYRLPGGLEGFPRRGELVYTAYQGDTVIGWGSTTRELWSPSVLLVVGVFPDFARQGLRNRIAAEIIHLAFADPDTERISTAVLHANPAMEKRMHRDVELHGLWIHSGTITYPVGMDLFSLPRAHWRPR